MIITTGSQGESMAALSRMANNMHRKITIGAGDTVIFSSNPIPGNEKSVTKIINELLRKGADVIFQDAHVSGHACQEEIKLIYTLIHPKYAVPVHGEYKHLKAQAKIAESLGLISKDKYFHPLFRRCTGSQRGTGESCRKGTRRCNPGRRTGCR